MKQTGSPINVIVLGSTGMLGHAVVDHLARNHRFNVFPLSRLSGFEAMDPELKWWLGSVDYVINCAGVIWQAKNPSRRDTFYVNSVFPHLLSNKCKRLGARLIHVSTDCVFSGKEGGYTEFDACDANDDYGFSKRLGEPAEAMVIRSSVIGRELKTQRSFLEWAISSRGTQVRGYANHVWNGVTTDEYARICSDIMLNGLYEEGVHHVFSPVSVSKYELLRILSDHLGLGLDVLPVNTPESVDRSLTSEKRLNAQLDVPSIYTMVSRLKLEP